MSMTLWQLSVINYATFNGTGNSKIIIILNFLLHILTTSQNDELLFRKNLQISDLKTRPWKINFVIMY